MIWDKIIGLLDPVEGIIDQVITNKEEKGKIKNEFERIRNDLKKEALEVEKQLIKSRGDAVKAEIQGKSWLQRNWRPLLMLTVIVIIFNNYVLVPYLSAYMPVEILDLPGGLWALLTTGTGGYVLGRSAEKISDKRKL